MQIIKLLSSDNEIFEVDVEIVKTFETLKTMLEEMGTYDDKVVTLPGVNSSILNKVMQWATFHPDDPPSHEDDSDDDKDEEDHISDWVADFLNVDTCIIYELYFAAKYLNFKSLLEVISKNIADIVKGGQPRLNP